jgi:ATP-dependent RNA helicase DHX29
MGPKRKKKPVANPARGFATTSTASKAKLDSVTDVADDLESSKDAVSTEQSAVTASASGDDDKELSQLSPDELEKRLEENELQSMVEKHVHKVVRDSDRHISRLRVDRRVLRSQSVLLPTQDWFNEGLHAPIWDLIRRELLFEEEEHSAIPDRPSINSLIPKLWTLQRVLRALGCTKQKIHGAFQWLCKHSPPASPESSLWGLNECLEVLAVNGESEDMFVFDKAAPKSSSTPSISSQLGEICPST